MIIADEVIKCDVRTINLGSLLYAMSKVLC